MTRNRIRTLTDGMLVIQLRFIELELMPKLIKQKDWRRNPSETGMLYEMSELHKINELKDQKQWIQEEIRQRKAHGSWNPLPIEKSMVAKNNPPVLEKVKSDPVRDGSYQSGNEREQELAIKVISKDSLRARAWEPEDGPIHGPTPSDTISDIRIIK